MFGVRFFPRRDESQSRASSVRAERRNPRVQSLDWFETLIHVLPIDEAARKEGEGAQGRSACRVEAAGLCAVGVSDARFDEQRRAPRFEPVIHRPQTFSIGRARRPNNLIQNEVSRAARFDDTAG